MKSFQKKPRSSGVKEYKSGRGAEPAAPAEPKQLSWDEIAALPVMMFHSAGGPPLIGHVQIGANGVIMHAPAQATMPSPKHVLFQPVPFVRRSLEILWSGIRARNVDTDDVVLRGYDGFFAKFREDAYVMAPIAVQAEIGGKGGHLEEFEDDAPSATKEQMTQTLAHMRDKIMEEKETPAPMEHCPACNMEVSNWRAHFPVLLDTSEITDGDGGSLGLPQPLADTTLLASGVPTVGWSCEINRPNIREEYAGYEPPQPLTVEGSSIQ